MKIEIDFDNKVIKVGNKVNFKKLLDFVKTLDNWKEYEIDTQTQIVWGSYQYYPSIPYYPTYSADLPLYNSPANVVLSTSNTDPISGIVQFELN